MFLPYLKHYHLQSEWQKFINRPAKQQLLEETITFFAQWMQVEKNISYSHIKTELDNFAQLAMDDLKIKNPLHPIFSITSEQFSYWQYNNIDKNQWNNKDSRQILDVLCELFYTKIQFVVQCNPSIISDMNCYYISDVSYRSYFMIRLYYKYNLKSIISYEFFYFLS